MLFSIYFISAKMGKNKQNKKKNNNNKKKEPKEVSLSECISIVL